MKIDKPVLCCKCDSETEYINNILTHLKSIKDAITSLDSLLSDDSKNKLTDFKNVALTRNYADGIMWSGKRISECTVLLERELIRQEINK